MLDKDLIEQYAKINTLMVRCVAMQTANRNLLIYSEKDFHNISKLMLDVVGFTEKDYFNYENINKIFGIKKPILEEPPKGRGNDNLKFCNIDGKLQDNVMMIRITGDDEDSKRLALFYNVLSAVKSVGLSVEITRFGGEVVNHKHGV